MTIKDIKVKPSKTAMVFKKNNNNNNYQRVVHVLYITYASFDLNQHQPFAHLKAKEQKENIFKTKSRGDATCLYACLAF